MTRHPELISRHMLPQLKPFGYVPDRGNFLDLFPHRYDFIVAKHHPWGSRADWRTESRYPLSDRLIEQADKLYGVRFGKRTEYTLIDIDAGSAYLTSVAIARIKESLEPLGLAACVAVQSSASRGLHLFFPLGSSQSSDRVAVAIATQLEQAGFTLAPGQLEIFPNVRTHVDDGPPPLFNAHRLPLQEPGSVLLADDLASYAHSSQSSFCERWKFAERRNDCTDVAIARAIRRRRRQYKISASAAKFLADLDADIEAGWTDHGQTNHLLGRITLREYVFGHLLGAGASLVGEELQQRVEQIARALPGFGDWCRHQQELGQRVAQWVQSVEVSRYYPYGSKRGEKPDRRNDWNDRQQQGAIDRIKAAIAQLAGQTLPTKVREVCSLLEQAAKVSRSTLYKYRELWKTPLPPPAETAPPPEPEPAAEAVLHPFPTNKLSADEAVTAAPISQVTALPVQIRGGVRGGFPQVTLFPSPPT